MKTALPCLPLLRDLYVSIFVSYLFLFAFFVSYLLMRLPCLHTPGLLAFLSGFAVLILLL